MTMTTLDPATDAVVREPVDPEDHLQGMVAWLSRRVAAKYRAGQLEHGGRLWRKPMLAQLLAEAVDLVVYLFVWYCQHQRLRGLLVEARNLLREAASGHRPDLVLEALDRVAKADNLLRHGNVDGIDEVELNPNAAEAA